VDFHQRRATAAGQAVRLDLDRLYGEPDEGTAAVDDLPPGGYLKATGRVPGLLKRWTCGSVRLKWRRLLVDVDDSLPLREFLSANSDVTR
jgi:hypothetical protein